MNESLRSTPHIVIDQVREIAELFGFETRNKYSITDASGQKIGYAAEQQKGLLNLIVRQYLGHWRRFDIFIFDLSGQKLYQARHPFRWFFQRLELSDASELKLGAIEQKFAIFGKKFQIEDRNGRVFMTVSSPLWRLWTFKFERAGREVARIEKKWAGLLNEAFTDKDRFRLSFNDSNLSLEERALLLASALFIDLQYFEKKAD